MDPDDPFQVWSFCDGQIVCIVGSNFTFCLHDERDLESVGKLEIKDEKNHLPGDMRGHYTSASEMGYWKRIT